MGTGYKHCSHLALFANVIPQGLSAIMCIEPPCSFLQLHSIPLCGSPTADLTFPLLMDTEVVSELSDLINNGAVRNLMSIS